MKKGFTLIEVLTVVLIIAVLTAVATPQYRRVVERSYATEAISMLRSLYDSSERLAAEFGARNYQELLSKDREEVDGRASIARLDIIPSDNYGYEFRCNVPEGQSVNTGYVMACPSGDDPAWSYILYQNHPGSHGDMTQGGKYIVALRRNGTYSGTKIFFERETQNILCEDSDERACDVYNLDRISD